MIPQLISSFNDDDMDKFTKQLGAGYISIISNLMDNINNSRNAVKVKIDLEKEYIEYDLNKMIPNQMYFVKYQGDSYIMKKIDNDEVVFYEVVE